VGFGHQVGEVGGFCGDLPIDQITEVLLLFALVVAHVSPSTAAVSDLDCGAEAGLECHLQPSLRLFRCLAFLTDIQYVPATSLVRGIALRALFTSIFLWLGFALCQGRHRKH
jgi:hypothetical protein